MAYDYTMQFFRVFTDWTVLSQVVLPDAKDDKNDVVVFLNAAHACNTEEDALQSGALAALHAVAGDRNLHRILPAAFGMLWDTLSEEVRFAFLPLQSHPHSQSLLIRLSTARKIIN